MLAYQAARSFSHLDRAERTGRGVPEVGGKGFKVMIHSPLSGYFGRRVDMSVLANKIGEMLLKGNLITADQLCAAPSKPRKKRTNGSEPSW